MVGYVVVPQEQQTADKEAQTLTGYIFDFVSREREREIQSWQLNGSIARFLKWELDIHLHLNPESSHW